MNTPDPENRSRERTTPVTTSGSSPYQQRVDGESSRFSSRARNLEIENLILRLFRHEPLTELDYKAIQSKLAATDEFATRLRNQLFGYILRAEDNFLQFVDVRKPLPLGLLELKEIDTFLSPEIAPLLTSEQRLQWFKRIVSHLAYLGRYTTWGPEHLDQLRHTTSMLYRLGTQDILTSRADVHTRREFQHAVAAVFSRAATCCSDISAYPALFQGLETLVILPRQLFSSECKAGLQALHAELRDFLPEANGNLDRDERTGTFLGDHGKPSHHATLEGWDVIQALEAEPGHVFVEPSIIDSQSSKLTMPLQGLISDSEYAYYSLVSLINCVAMALADLSEAEDREAMQDLCYTYSFHEPEWLHYMRGLVRADPQGSTLVDVMTDLLRAAAQSAHAAWQLVGLVASDLLLDDTGRQPVIRALALATGDFTDEQRTDIRNKVYIANSNHSDKTSDAAGIPIDPQLFKAAFNQVILQVYPEEFIGTRELK
jgi:hypothetical protein